MKLSPLPITRCQTLFILLLAALQAAAQPYLPGQSYPGTNGYIEYIAGNLPLILSAPHGGELQPASIPDRDCSGCSNVNDAYTQELSREVLAAVHDLSGCYPHLVINRLHRKKLDANRDLPEAADGNPDAGLAWQEFHSFLESARSQVLDSHGKGFFVDLHGHAHTIQRLELGYLLYSDELQMSDPVLNTPAFVNYSSLRNLAGDNLNGFSHAELLRGTHSLGTYLDAAGYPAVPSAGDPFPGVGEPYFSGGYNTARHSSYEGGTIDGVQVECNQQVRFDAAVRQAFAARLAQALLDFLEMHYFGESTGTLCLSTATPTAPTVQQPVLLPQPACQSVFLENFPHGAVLGLFSTLGHLVMRAEPGEGASLDLSGLPDGLYFWQVRDDSRIRGSGTLLKHCP